jgi:glucose/arabinose dehydrogenase
VTLREISTSPVQVIAPNGERGAALAQLMDGRLLLGGGGNGSNLYLFDRTSESLTMLGRVINSSERINDSRFAVTDIAVLKEAGDKISLLISFPKYNRTSKCVSVVLLEYQLILREKNSLTRGKEWFRSAPCVPISAVQHAAGRMAVINEKSVYLTIGDLGFTKINQRGVRGTLGSIYKVSKDSSQRISQGHRNPQGIELIENRLYISEHGPRGGDELNLIAQGKDYGWPFVTYGEPYGAGDYVRPSKTSTHEGFTQPLKYWVPSVAPTELIKLPSDAGWGKWSGNLVMGTLRENSLIFIELISSTEVGEISALNVGERIRDLEVDTDGVIIASTDAGTLLFLSPN